MNNILSTHARRMGLQYYDNRDDWLKKTPRKDSSFMERSPKVRPLNRLSRIRFWGKVLGTVVLLAWCSLGFVAPVGAKVLSAEDFEQGSFSGWTPFVTVNGTTGGVGWPKIESFPVQNDQESSQSLRMKVGQVRYKPDREPQQGGGLSVEVSSAAGTLDLSVFVAVVYQSPKDRRNLAGGLFEWIVDGQVVGSHEVGPIKNNTTVRHHFQAQAPVKAGTHTIQIRVTRPFVSHPQQEAPYQYLDQLQVEFRATP